MCVQCVYVRICVMSTLTAVSRSPICPLSPFIFSDIGANQQVPGSPLSPFYGITMRMPRPSSISPGPVVPELSSPCLRKILASQKSKNKRQSSSPLVSSTKKAKKHNEVPSVTSSFTKHSQRVPVTPAQLGGAQEQVVPGGCSPLLTDIDEPQTISQRKLPLCVKDGIKPLELFTGDSDIFASVREE